MSKITIFAALLVVPPDFIEPAPASKTLRKLISPDDVPPPDNISPLPLNLEKLVPVPEPYLNSLASFTSKSNIPPSFTKSSSTFWIKQA